jgi:hypothetical protein
MNKKLSKVAKPLFEIPLIKRTTSTFDGLGCETTPMSVDGLGVFVTHHKTSRGFFGELAPENIRQYLMGRYQTSCLIEAETMREAVDEFVEKWAGAQVGGGQGPESFALWINPLRPITKFGPCPRLYIERGQLVCGPEDLPDDCQEYDIFGGCVLEGYDSCFEEGCMGDKYQRKRADFEFLYSQGDLLKVGV